MDRYYGNEWGRKGATISDKTARLEYGLTQDEIYDAIDAGKLQYRPAAMHGNPWLRLLRREVEDLARTLHGDRDVREKQARAELARVNRELKQLRSQLAALEERRAALLSELGEKRPRQQGCQVPICPDAPRRAGHPAQPAAHSTTPQTAAAPGLHTIAKVDFVHVGTAKHALPPRHRCCLHP